MTSETICKLCPTIVLCLLVNAEASADEPPCESISLDLSPVYENQLFPDEDHWVSLPEGWRANRSQVGAITLLNVTSPDGAMVSILASREQDAKQSLDQSTASTVKRIEKRDGMSVVSTGRGKTCFAEKTYEFAEIYVRGLLPKKAIRLELHQISTDSWHYQVQLWADSNNSALWRTLRTIRFISNWD